MTDQTMTSGAESAVPANPQHSRKLAGLQLPMLGKAVIVIGVLIALTIPFSVESFTMYQVTLALIYAIGIVGLNLLTGFNGQFSLGHSTFFALGAYTTAVMMNQWDVSFYATVIPAAVVCLVAGFLFGLPALRLDGLYLALATFALAIATPQLLKHKHLEEYTGGVQGLDAFKPEAPGWFIGLNEDVLDDNAWLYYMVLAFLILTFWLANRLVKSRTGRALIAIRDNPLSAKTMGINLPIYKATTFGVSAMFTGVAGALSAIAVEFVAPESFTFNVAIMLLVGLVVGGVGSIYGAIFGGFFVLLVPNFSESFGEWLKVQGVLDQPQGLTWAIYGLFLILAVYVMPGGMMHLVNWVVNRFASEPTK